MCEESEGSALVLCELSDSSVSVECGLCNCEVLSESSVNVSAGQKQSDCSRRR